MNNMDFNLESTIYTWKLQVICGNNCNIQKLSNVTADQIAK